MPFYKGNRKTLQQIGKDSVSMRKRIISFVLVLSMLLSMMPGLPVRADAASTSIYPIHDMTEAEAFAAGPHVYTAWYHYRDFYPIENKTLVDMFYKHTGSAFNRLYDTIFPDTETQEEVFARIDRTLEDHFDGVEQVKQIEDDVQMSLLLACFLYTGKEGSDSSSDAQDVLEAAQAVGLNARDISTFYLTDHLAKESTFFSKNFFPSGIFGRAGF